MYQNHLTQKQMIQSPFLRLLRKIPVLLFGGIMVLFGFGIFPFCGAGSIFPPPEVHVPPVYEQETFTQQSWQQTRALFIVVEPDVLGIATEMDQLDIFESFTVLLEDDSIFYTDLVGLTDAPRYKVRNKIPHDLFECTSPQGVFNSYKQYNPSLDPMVAFHTGYEIAVKFIPTGLTKQIILPPLYDTHLYTPYHREGWSAPVAPAGRSFTFSAHDEALDGDAGTPGENGESGRDAYHVGVDGGHGGGGGDGISGVDGDDGDSYEPEGEPGTSGSMGGNGGHGGDGFMGEDGLRGDDAEDGSKGPDLYMQFKPIYSKFYPTRVLIYLSVRAVYVDGTSRNRIYVFQPNQPFTLTTVGGAGGNGGDGGRGGDGGNGGNGGDGGHGGNGGDGGDGYTITYEDGSVESAYGGDGGYGGNGGNGGDGGNGASPGRGGDAGNGGCGGNGGDIHVSIDASLAGFRERIVDYYTFQSIGGNGGRGGTAGRNGNVGEAGRFGRAGQGGSGGDGGDGDPEGQDGDDGADGKSGSRGDDGQSIYQYGSDGEDGEDGIPGRIYYSGLGG